MVNLKTTTVSYKVHKLIRKPEEEWSIVPNAQEAIIDENTWLRVQELRKNKRHLPRLRRGKQACFPDWFFVQTAVQSSTFVRLRV